MVNYIGQQLGNYRLLRLLGQGGFSDVYLGEHLHLKTLAAIKVLQVRLLASMMEQFQTEAQAIASLVHPHIVRILDFGLTDGVPFLIMDYAPNGTLRDQYPKGTRLPLATIVSYVRQVADALQYAHENKLIHRDIKPENMLLGQHDTLLLSDFGLVLVAQSSESRSTKEIAGTVPYMAPEQIQGKPRPASDQYALGIVVYEWLSGTRPFEGSVFEIYGQHLHMAPPSFDERNVSIPSSIEEVVMTALAKDPRERFASVTAFATALEQASHLTQSSALDHPSMGDNMLDQSALSTFVKTPPSQAARATGVNTPPEASEEPTYLKTPLSQSSLPTAIHTPSANQALPTVIKPPPDESSQSTPIVPPTDQASSSHTTMTPQLHTPHTVSPGQSSQTQLPSAPPAPQTQSTQPIADVLPIGGSGGSHVSRPRRRGKRWVLTIALVLLVLLLTCGGLAYAEPGVFSSLTQTLFGSPSTAIVTLTPTSNDLKKTYTIAAVTGIPDTSKHQVQAHQLSSTTPQQSKTVNATEPRNTQPSPAKGYLTFANNQGSAFYLNVPLGTTWTGNDGIQVMNDQPVCLQGSDSDIPSIDVSAHSVSSGSSSNIAAYDIKQNVESYASTTSCSLTAVTAALTSLTLRPEKVTKCDCRTSIALGNGIRMYTAPLSGGSTSVYNTAAFTGGKDSSTYSVVRQSDIEGAANALETPPPDPQQVLQGQVHANEHFVGTPTCNPNVTPDHNAGDAATTVTVRVTFTCRGEVYDQQGALTMAQQWLKQDAVQNPGTGYMLVGTIVTTQGPAQISNTDPGTIVIPVTAEGVWVYQFSSAQEQAIAKQIAGKKKAKAQTLLQQRGVAHANIEISGGDGNTLPVDSQQIRFVILSVNGK